MKAGWLVLAILFSLVLVVHIAEEVYVDYRYDNEVADYWDLSERASTLDQKAVYLDKFVAAIENSHLSGNDALFLPTPATSYDQNLIAVKSLQTRMHEIQTMDVRSLEYQQAINQITAQEQGEAHGMLHTFKGLWFKQNYFTLWGDIDFLRWLGEIILCIVFWALFANAD